jgi:hypothetical protein
VFSIPVKTLGGLLLDKMRIKERIKQGNVFPKKYPIRLHYWVDPLAFGVAIVHFISSECRSTVMPALGLGAMLSVLVLGFRMTLGLSPPFMRKLIFRLHTNPITTIAVFSFLLIGHLIME